MPDFWGGAAHWRKVKGHRQSRWFEMVSASMAPLASTFGDKVTVPAWKRKPCWYQISSEDQTISPENQKKLSAQMNPRKIITLTADRASLSSMAVDISTLIHEAAAELNQ